MTPMTKLTSAQQALHQGLITLLSSKKINQVSIKELTKPQTLLEVLSTHITII